MKLRDLFTRADGRIDRFDFWTGNCVLGLFPILGIVLDVKLGTRFTEHDLGVFHLIFALISIYPFSLLSAKRWHDRGKSGWWTLILLVPIIGLACLLIELGLLRGTDGSNQYGPYPSRA